MASIWKDPKVELPRDESSVFVLDKLNNRVEKVIFYLDDNISMFESEEFRFIPNENIKWVYEEDLIKEQDND